MKKVDPFIVTVIAILVILLAMINLVTETAISEETEKLKSNLISLQTDILENMIGDYISSMNLVDDMAIESDSHNVEASMKLMDYMMNSVEPSRRAFIFKIFGEDTHIPIAMFNSNSRQIEYASDQNAFFIGHNAIKEAEFFLKQDDFYYLEDSYLTANREISKQRLFFYKSNFSPIIFISKVSFEGVTKSIKESSQAAINKTLGKIETVIGSKVVAINGEGKVVLSSDSDFLQLGVNLLRMPGNESLLHSLKSITAEKKLITLYDKDEKLVQYGFKWFKSDQIYVLKINEKKDMSKFMNHNFFMQRLLMLISIVVIILIIILMRRNFLYFLEKSSTQEGV